jgi:hypothetical protein
VAYNVIGMRRRREVWSGISERRKEKEGGGVGNSERVGFDFERSVDVEVEDEGRDYNDTSQRKNNRLGKR